MVVIRSKQKIIVKEPFNIVLVEPEIPPNTGNIARLCAATNTKLHLIHPLGFKITDRELKRAGLDYWHLLGIQEYKDWNSFYRLRETSNRQRFWFLSTRGGKNIWEVKFNQGDFLIFGSETKGLSEDILNNPLNKDKIISIPMNGLARSLNLSTAVGVVLYEAMRQVTVEKKLYEVVPLC